MATRQVQGHGRQWERHVGAIIADVDGELALKIAMSGTRGAMSTIATGAA